MSSKIELLETTTPALASTPASPWIPQSPPAQPTAPAELEFLTLDETARWLRCSTRTLQRLLETGTGPPVIRVSERRLIFRLTDVRKWLAGRTRGAAELSAPRRRGRPRKREAEAGTFRREGGGT
jgi:hypothetical protein